MLIDDWNIDGVGEDFIFDLIDELACLGIEDIQGAIAIQAIKLKNMYAKLHVKNLLRFT